LEAPLPLLVGITRQMYSEIKLTEAEKNSKIWIFMEGDSVSVKFMPGEKEKNLNFQQFEKKAKEEGKCFFKENWGKIPKKESEKYDPRPLYREIRNILKTQILSPLKFVKRAPSSVDKCSKLVV